MEKLYEYLINFGFKKEDVDRIVNTYPLKSNLPERILINAQYINNFFLTQKISKRQIIKMVRMMPKLYVYNADTLKQKIDNLANMLFIKDIEVLKMIKKMPQIFCLSEENIKNTINYLISLGYTIDDIRIMMKKFPTLVSFSEENLNQKINNLINFGFNNDQVIQITKALPTIFSYQINHVNEKLNWFLSLGYNQTEVIKIITTLPAILGFSLENIQNKVDFYKEIGLDYLILNETRQLIQSVELSYARYHYLKHNNIPLNSHRMLFYSKNNFQKQFNISSEQLLSMYPYKKDMEILKNS